MQDIIALEGFPNPVFSAATAGDLEAAQQRVQNDLNDAAQVFADRGGALRTSR